MHKKAVSLAIAMRPVYGINKIRVQIRSDSVYGNRPYGFAFDVYQLGLYKSIKAHIEATQI
jgi:hypothetical protein